MKRYNDYSLLKHNTFGIDVKADEFIEYESVDELKAIIPELKERKVLHIGGGSNLLFTGDFHGVILHSGIKFIETKAVDSDYVTLSVGAGVVWDELVEYTVKHGWGGLANLSLIPGEVGAAAVQNIGAYGAEAKDVITLVKAIDLATGEEREFKNQDCNYAYRQSIFKNELKGRYAITQVEIKFSKNVPSDLTYGNLTKAMEGRTVNPENLRQTVIDVRNSKLPQPEILGNAGSFFMNPVVSQEKFERLWEEYPDMPYYYVEGGVKIPAGWLIEMAGWKGRALGDAAVYSKQALVIVNLKHGIKTADHILELAKTIIYDVKMILGIDISPEVNFI